MKPRKSQLTAIALAALILSGSLVATISISPTATAAEATSGGFTESFTDSFEDEPADSGLPEKWEWRDKRAPYDALGVSTAESYDGVQSFRVNTNANGGVAKVTPAEQPYANTVTANATAAVKAYSGNGAFYALENGNQVITFRVSETGAIQYKTSAGYQDLTAANYGGVWVKLKFSDVDPVNDTYSLKWTSSAGNGTATGLSMESPMETGYDELQLGALHGDVYFDGVEFNRDLADVNGLNGRVVSCPAVNPDCSNPTGVPNGTVVEAYGVRESYINTSAGQTLSERADELRNDIRTFDSAQLGWDPSLQLAGSGGEFANADGKYVAVHRPDSWALEKWSDAPDLSSPILTAPANEDVILSVWDTTNNPTIQDGMDSDLPGAIDDDTDIIVQQLDYEGDVVGSRPISTSETAKAVWWSSASDHDYARVNLPPGFYRVKAKGSAFSYVMTVGDPSELTNKILSDLKTESGQLSTRAQEIQDLVDQNKVVKVTTTTFTQNGEQGHFQFSTIPSDVHVVAVQAYTPSATEYQLDDPKNASLQELREVAALDTYNGSFIITPRAKDVQIPAENATVKAVELDAAPFMDMGRFGNKTAWLQNLFQKDSFNDAVVEYLDLSQPNSEEILSRLQDLKNANSQLEQRYEDLLDGREGELDSSREEIRLLRQAIRDLQGGIQITDPTTDYTDGKVSATIPWDGELDPDSANVVAHLPNLGESRPVGDEYVSVEKRPGRPDVLKVTDYPVPDGTNMVTFGVTVSGEDGGTVGNGKVSVTNPNFEGRVLNLDSISLSSIRPGPNERVSVTLNTGEDSARIQSITPSVEGPSGSVQTNPGENARTFTFQTNGSGEYYATLEITDSAGNTWAEALAVKADDESVNQPPSVRARGGFTGVYAVVSDGLEGGSVRTDSGKLSVSAVASAKNIPSSVHFYTSELSSNYERTTAYVQQTSGSGEPESVRKHVKASLHTANVEENAVVYRNGDEPLSVTEETAYGAVICEESDTDGCTLRSYTDAGGSATFTIINNPTIVDRAIHYVRLNSPVGLPFLIISPDLGGLSGANGVPLAVTFQFQFQSLPTPLADAGDMASAMSATPVPFVASGGGVSS